MRLDKYLKVSRLIKRRTVANEACDAGSVLVNDRPAKASVNVKAGTLLRFSLYAFRQIHDYHKGYVLGSITYSEGIHDDVSKMVWGNLDYREEAPVEEAIRDYVRFFIDPDLTDELSGLIFKLEESWTGRILENANIDALYEKMMSIDKTVSRETGKNFRYQMLLLRILGDYQTKLRYAHDQQLEKGSL